MPAPYGVVESGFNKKVLAEVLADLEAAEQAQFGAGVVLDPQSPLGQLNGIFSDAMAEAWEIAEAVYNAYDPDHADGAQLDRIGAIRGVLRLVDETDTSYRARIVNSGVGDIRTRQLYTQLSNIDGVTWVNISDNTTTETLANGLLPHSVAIAVEGGSDADIAATIINYVPAGIGLTGDTVVETAADGFCRSVAFSRPQQVSLEIQLDVSLNPDRCNCAATATSDVAIQLAATLSNTCAMYNGMTLTAKGIHGAVSSIAGLIVECVRFGPKGGDINTLDKTFGLAERPVVISGDITVSTVPAGTRCATVGTGSFEDAVIMTNTVDDPLAGDAESSGSLQTGTIA